MHSLFDICFFTVWKVWRLESRNREALATLKFSEPERSMPDLDGQKISTWKSNFELLDSCVVKPSVCQTNWGACNGHCWQKHAWFLKRCCHSCGADSAQKSNGFWWMVNFGLWWVWWNTFFLMWKWNFDRNKENVFVYWLQIRDMLIDRFNLFCLHWFWVKIRYLNKFTCSKSHSAIPIQSTDLGWLPVNECSS